MRITEEDVQRLVKIVGAENAVVEAAALEKYNVDWTQKYRGRTRLVLCPRETAQVALVMEYCWGHGLGVVPQGGNTGLVGGATPMADEIILSTERMNRVLSFDGVSSVVSLECGVTLQAADAYLRERGHMMPVDFGAKARCTVGGILATNAAGLRFLRYGGMQAAVVGVEAVLADGRVLGSLNGCPKDNTGYALRNLLVGSEGTLAIITAANLRVPIAPASVHLLVLAVPSMSALLGLYVETRDALGEILSAFEFWDSQAQALLDDFCADGDRPPMPVPGAPFYCLVETHGACSEADRRRLEAHLLRSQKCKTEELACSLTCLLGNFVTC